MAGHIQIRAAAHDIRAAAGRRLQGYAAVFGSVAQMGGTSETIANGAFAKALASGNDIVGLLDHDPSKVLGRTKSGTLELREDAHGLAFDLSLPDTQPAADVLALARRGDLGGMSFGFLVPPGGDRWDGSRRTLLAIDLREISVVSAWPAYDGTSVAARAQMNPTTRVRLARLFLETV